MAHGAETFSTLSPLVHLLPPAPRSLWSSHTNYIPPLPLLKVEPSPRPVFPQLGAFKSPPREGPPCIPGSSVFIPTVPALFPPALIAISFSWV